MMADACVFCPSSLVYDDDEPTADERDELFHKPCSTCSSSNFQTEPLCSSCQHLRLRHLVMCVDAKTRNRFLFALRKNLNVEDNKAIHCPLCRMLNHMILSGADLSLFSHLERTNSTLVLDTRVSQWEGLEVSGILEAEIYAYHKDGESTSFSWIGNLHVDDTSNTTTLPCVGEMVSWTRMQSKITECYEKHSGCRQKDKRCLPNGFRVIDVLRRRIVEIGDRSFVALSYVWGLDTRSSLLTGTRATIDEMRKDGGLPKSDMPRTIEDAMNICVQLGESYLWADRLCIIQDDVEDKMNQIGAMNDIYSSARIVLVAAYGDSMDFGIPGVGRQRDVVQHHEEVMGLRVTNIIREVEHDPLALWNTRGWTYQESILSRRRLYFTNVQAFFECGQSIWHEDQYNAEKVRNEFTSDGLIISEDGSRFDAFVRHLRNYTSRSLTYQSDAYNALSGISRSLYDGRFIHGLPQVDFDRALRWYPDSGSNTIYRAENQGVILPTWSWSSAMGLSDEVQYQATGVYGTLVPWYDNDGFSLCSDMLEPANIHPETDMDDDWQVYMAIACSKGCITNISFPLSLETNSFETIREKFSISWKSYYVFCKEAIQSISISTRPPQTPTLLSPETDMLLKDMMPGAILTKAQTAFFPLGDRLTRVVGPSNFGLGILDTEGKNAGELCGDVARLRGEIMSPQYNKDTLYEFIGISLSGKPIHAYSGKERETKNYFDMDGNSLARLPIVNVLMIGWRGPHAYRRELGWIYLTDWAKAVRIEKMILLG